MQILCQEPSLNVIVDQTTLVIMMLPQEATGNEYKISHRYSNVKVVRVVHSIGTQQRHYLHVINN